MRLRILFVLIPSLSVTSVVQASLIVPAGLNPGDPYHLAFVTRQGRTAVSTDISSYNTFVNNQADQAGAITENFGIEWFAIGSTSTVNARENAVVGAGVPVYLLDGTTKIADGFADLWDGSIDNTLSLNQFGLTTQTTVAWTGSFSSGVAASVNFAPLGSVGPPGGIPEFVAIGRPFRTDSAWIFSGGFSADAFSPVYPLYALSEELTAPSTAVIPEPSSLILFALGAVGLLGCAARRKRKHVSM